MRLQRSRLPVLALLFLLVGSLLVGCAARQPGGAQSGDTTRPEASASPQENSSSTSIDQSVPPVLLSNPSPGQLEVSVNVSMGGYDPSTRDITSISLGFQSGGRPVQFTGQEHLVCNGTDLMAHDRDAIFEMTSGPTSALEGQTITCTYSAGGVSATFALTIPQAPAILSPRDQAQVRRAAKTLITYEARGGQLLGIVALGPENKAIARLDTPGPGQATVDTSAFSAGAGSLSLTEALEPHITQMGTPFKALDASGMGLTVVNVIWV